MIIDSQKEKKLTNVNNINNYEQSFIIKKEEKSVASNKHSLQVNSEEQYMTTSERQQSDSIVEVHSYSNSSEENINNNFNISRLEDLLISNENTNNVNKNSSDNS